MKKSIAILLSALLISTMAGCGDKKESSSEPESSTAEQTTTADSAEKTTDTKEDSTDTTTTPPVQETTTEVSTEPPHISPIEPVISMIGVQQTVNTKVSNKKNNNTIKFSLADFMQEGDTISSFIFVVKADKDIGEFKGGCGISVYSDCPDATDEGWYQSKDFTVQTDGKYAEIEWVVPRNLSSYVSESGEVLFGYWWGDVPEITVTEVICNIIRLKEVPCDGTIDVDVKKSVGFNDEENTIHIPTDFLPENAIPQAVTYKVNSKGAFRKFTGGCGYKCSEGYFQSEDIVIFTDDSKMSFTWLVPDYAKYPAEDGEIILGYWWSDQPELTLDSISVKYSIGENNAASSNTSPVYVGNTNFRDSAEIVDDIKVGWNLGNTLESYDTGKSGLSTETGWGNPKTTEEMILAVKEAGFNAIRIPVTWGEHMDGNVIQEEWLNRVQEVVDYAYNNNMYVILNMHHDDYIWFNPTDAEYKKDSAKLKKIWEQISKRFKDYGDTLIFEGMNEARTIGSENEWIGGTADERAVVNQYAQDFVDTVRASGGNNTARTLIVTSYGACAEEVAMNDLIVPYDRHVIVSLHYYAPWKFSDGQSTVFDTYEQAELEAKFASMKKKFIDKGIPLIIDEFGCVAAADDETRAKYYNYYISTAKQYGIKCFVWDNGVAKGEGAFGLLNRNKLEWNEKILKGIIDGSK